MELARDFAQRLRLSPEGGLPVLLARGRYAVKPLSPPPTRSRAAVPGRPEIINDKRDDALGIDHGRELLQSIMSRAAG